MCVCVYMREAQGSYKPNYSKTRKKQLWNKQQIYWPGAIAYTGWLIAFNDGVFYWCHVNEQMIGAFWSQTSRGVKKNRVGLNLSLRADESCVMGQQLASYSSEYAHTPKQPVCITPIASSFPNVPSFPSRSAPPQPNVHYLHLFRV